MKKVEVLWWDAFRLASESWYSSKEILDKVTENKPGELCSTLGYVLRTNESHIILAQTRQPEAKEDDEGYDGIFVIPNNAIVKIIVL